MGNQIVRVKNKEGNFIYALGIICIINISLDFINPKNNDPSSDELTIDNKLYPKYSDLEKYYLIIKS